MADQNEVFELLSLEPGTGVQVADRDGVLLYINDEAIRFFFGQGIRHEDLLGKKPDENGFPRAWSDERIELIRTIERTGEEAILRTIWKGRQQFSWFRSLGDEGGDFRVLVVTRRVGDGDEARHLLESEMAVVKSAVAGLGELCVLTKRELEVLALIGQGMTAKEIAELMHRSVKTVENHRISLGAKLQKSNKVELAMMAREAGLTVDDSRRARVCDTPARGG